MADSLDTEVNGVFGGHEHQLRQTVMAPRGGEKLSEHENLGEATVHVLEGRIKLDGSGTVKRR